MNFLSLLRAYGSILLLSTGLLIGGLGTLPAASAHANPALPPTLQAVPDDTRLISTVPPTFPLTALLAPGNRAILSDPWPTFDWVDPTDPMALSAIPCWLRELA